MIRTVTKIHGRGANNFFLFWPAAGINVSHPRKEKIREEISKWINQILTAS